MESTRRVFLADMGILSLAGTAMPALSLQEKQRRPMPTPPTAANPSETKQAPEAARAPHELPARREAEFRQQVSRLLEMVRDLKEELDGTQTTGTFSVKIYKETAEIERLAKQVKNLARS